MEMAEGYVTKMALDENDEVIGYEFIKVGKMLEDIRHGVSRKKHSRRIPALTVVLQTLQNISIRVKNKEVQNNGE